MRPVGCEVYANLVVGKGIVAIRADHSTSWYHIDQKRTEQYKINMTAFSSKYDELEPSYTTNRAILSTQGLGAMGLVIAFYFAPEDQEVRLSSTERSLNNIKTQSFQRQLSQWQNWEDSM